MINVAAAARQTGKTVQQTHELSKALNIGVATANELRKAMGHLGATVVIKGRRQQALDEIEHLRGLIAEHVLPFMGLFYGRRLKKLEQDFAWHEFIGWDQQ